MAKTTRAAGTPSPSVPLVTPTGVLGKMLQASCEDFELNEKKTMTDKFYQVLAAIGESKTEMLFSDLSAKELDEQFVTPYRRGKTFFAGASVVNPSELRKVRIIETLVKEAEARHRINRDSLAEIAEMNRTSGFMIISAGQGYETEDVVEAGVDVTRNFLRGGPGSPNSLLGLSKTAASWILTIVASVLAAGLVKWLGWI